LKASFNVARLDAYFEAADRLAKSASLLGLAMPLANGQFRVARFDLDGSNAAIALMRNVAEQAASTPSNSRKTTDKTI
jgi:hypothetical protein